jgi:hypothetical protein
VSHTPTRIADDWTPGEADRAFAIEQGLDDGQIAHCAKNFLDHWLAAVKNAAKMDWFAAWRTWVRKDIEHFKSVENIPRDRVPTKPGAKSTKFFAQLGTAQWAAWDKHFRATRGVGPPQDDIRWPTRDDPLRRGYLFDTEWPPGYEPAAAPQPVEQQMEMAA